MGCKYRHGIGHGRQHATDGVFQQLAAFDAAVVENIAPVLVEQAHVHVHAVAAATSKGLRHEGGADTPSPGDALHHVPQQRAMIRRRQRHMHVLEIDLVLAGGEFSRRHRSRNPLHDGGPLHVAEQIRESVHLVNPIDLSALVAQSGQW